MPSLKGFSDNPFKTRDHLVTACYALLEPLNKYQSPAGARIRLPVGTGTHFDEVAAQLEGFARPLWAIGSLLAGEGEHGEDAQIDPRLRPWIQGFGAGTDPTASPNEYWGEIGDKDQRMVELEILGFALLSAPRAFLGDPESQDLEVLERRKNITRYLRSVNGKEFPQTNWLWFRVLANLALVKSCGVPHEELRGSMERDLDVLDGFYVDRGWAADGQWSESGKQMDYYAGSFAIQYSQLMYTKFAAELDPERCEKFKKRARDFSLDFYKYFDIDGASVPFGRSLTYRFSMSAFWAAVVLSETELPAPLSHGVVKGLLLRNLRWWAQKEDIFYTDGTLNIGFCYPNMYMSEDYNSPQSTYWCMKTLCALGLPRTHAFWSTPEEPHPFSKEGAKQTLAVNLISPPRQIIVGSRNHHFLLSSGQYCGWPLKATEAKYAKFAYSSAFGFSVPTGQLIQQIAPDSTLALSEDGGESWKTRWKSEETAFEETIFYGSSPEDGKERPVERLPTLVNRWSPSKSSVVKVETTLIPPASRWPDWHIRVHKMEIKSAVVESLSMLEGGFAIHGRSKGIGGVLPKIENFRTLTEDDISRLSECVMEDETSSLIISSAGASGIRQLSSTFGGVKGAILKPDANTNLMVPRTLIPTLQQEIPQEATSFITVSAVFAVSNKSLSAKEIRTRWMDEPIVMIGDVPSETACIHIPE